MENTENKTAFYMFLDSNQKQCDDQQASRSVGRVQWGYGLSWNSSFGEEDYNLLQETDGEHLW